MFPFLRCEYAIHGKCVNYARVSVLCTNICHQSSFAFSFSSYLLSFVVHPFMCEKKYDREYAEGHESVINN